MLKWVLALLIVFSLTACDRLAVMFTPAKKPIYSPSALTGRAEKEFWQTLHNGRYADISQADFLLMAAYLQNPNDPTIAAHLGFLHIWKITERQRIAKLNPLIVNEIILSRKYFSEAVELNPNDARYLGFLGDAQLVEGQIFHDERLKTKGYFTLKNAIRKWPEFNLFSGGFVMSSLLANSKFFKEGLDWQWQTLNLCAGEKVNRANPDFTPYMKFETLVGPKRACWNSWIAPHNFEGFFMNMGDMLVKSGDWKTAQKIYRNAQLTKNYASWPYKTMLENRIKNAKENVKNFQYDNKNPDRTILFNSGRGCVACHQSH